MEPNRVLAILLVPAALTALAAPRMEASARTLATNIGLRLPPLPEVVPEEPLPPEDPDDDADVQGAPVVVASADAKETPSRKRKPRARPDASAPAGPSVFVPESAILRLARVRAVPDSAPVPATADRPAGVRLNGVSGLGLGMEDGDVITEVAGRKVRHAGDIVDVVIALRGRHAPTVNAVFYRGKARGTLVVAMPYPRGAP